MNLRKLRILLLLYAAFDIFIGGVCGGFFPLSQLAAAQFTIVSGTVTDPNGLAYANGTITATLVSSGTPKFTASNLPYFPPTQPVGLSSIGSFVMQLADNTALTPGGSTWSFTVNCASGCVPPVIGKGPIQFVVTGVTISGASQSITATLTAAAPALTAVVGGGGTGTVTSGTATQIAFYSASGTTIASNPRLTENGSTLAYTGASGFNAGPGGITTSGTHVGASASFTGSVTAGSFSWTGNVSAHQFFGNNTGSAAAPSMLSIGLGDLPATLVTSPVSGTTNTFPKYTGGATTANSLLTDNGNTLSYAGTGASFPAVTDTGVTGSTQCLHANSSGLISGIGADCGAATLPVGSQGNAIFNSSPGSGTTYSAAPNEFHSSSFVSPTLASLLALCPPGPTACNVVLDAGSGSINVASGNTGTVNTQNAASGGCSANCVTFVSGTQFNPNWGGSTININGAVFTIAQAGVISSTLIQLTTAPGTQTGVAYNAAVTIGSTSQPINVENRGVVLHCTQNFGIDCIEVAQVGNLTCFTPGKIGVLSGCTVIADANTNYSALISSAGKDNSQSQIFFSGHSVTAVGTATITRGMIDIVSVEGKGVISDMLVQGIANTNDVTLEDGCTACTNAGNNDINFIDLVAYCSGTSNCISINIVSGGGNDQASGYSFTGTNLGDPGKIDGTTNPCSGGPGGGCIINIDGSAAWNGTSFVTGAVNHYLNNIKFDNLYIEGCTAGVSCTTANVSYITVKNCKNCDLGQIEFAVGPQVDNCIYLAHSGAPFLGEVKAVLRDFGTRCTNMINNTVSGYTSGNANADLTYEYVGEQAGVVGKIVDGGITVNGHLNQSATGKFAGSCTMAAATTCTFAISAAYTGTPLCFASVQNAAPTTFQGSCALSGTTVTVTASAANSNVWAAELVGNPN